MAQVFMTWSRGRGWIVGLLFGCVVLSACRPSGRRALIEGDRLLQAGRAAEAVPLLERAAADLQTDGEAWNHLGRAYHELNQVNDARRAYLHALQVDRNLFDAHYNLGQLSLETGAWRDAEAGFRTWLGAGQNTSRTALAALAWRGLGIAQFRQGRLPDAERSFGSALRLNAKDAESWNVFGLIQQQRRQYREAYKSFVYASQLSPQFPAPRLNAAVVAHQFLNDRAAALGHYKAYLALNPSDAVAITQLIAQLEVHSGAVSKPVPSPGGAMEIAVNPSSVNPSSVNPSSVNPPETNPPANRPRPTAVTAPASNQNPSTTRRTVASATPPPPSAPLMEKRSAVGEVASGTSVNPPPGTPPTSTASPSKPPPIPTSVTPTTKTPDIPVAVTSPTAPPPPSSVNPPNPTTPVPASPPSTPAASPALAQAPTAPPTTPAIANPPSATPPPSAVPLEIVRVPQPPVAQPVRELTPPLVTTPPELPVTVPALPTTEAAPSDVKDSAPSVTTPAITFQTAPVASLSEATDAPAEASRKSIWSKANPWNWFKRDHSTDTTRANVKPITPLEFPPITEVSAPVRTPVVRTAPVRELAAANPAPVPRVVAPEPRIAPPTPPRPAIRPKPSFEPYQHQVDKAPAAGDRTAAERAFQTAYAAHQRGDLASALAGYQQVVSLDPAYFEAQHNLAQAAIAQGNGPVALRAAETATLLRPNDLNAHYQFAVALQQSRHPQDAVAELEHLATLQPTDASTHFGAALIYANDLQEPERARAHYDKVLALDPAHPQAAAIRRWLANNPAK